MRLYGWLLAVFILLTVSCGGGERRSSDAGQPAPKGRGIPLVESSKRVAAPKVQSASLGGGEWRLSDQRGKVVIVDFWATWCGPCRITIPHLVELSDKYAAQGLVVVGISLDRGGEGLVGPFVKQMGIRYPVIVDEPGRFANAFGGVEGIPAFFLIDRSGRIAGHMVGAGPKEMLEEAVRSLLAEA